MKTARAIAVRALNQLDKKLGYAGIILDKLLPQTEEKQRATDLVLGSIRNRPALDMIITKLADCPIERIPAKPLNIIRVGTYELIYSPQTPEYSIVNEAVENAKAVAGKKQTAFVNAVLRQITRHLRNRQIPLSQADTQKIIPQTFVTGCEFDTDILPNPKDSLADYLSAAFSLPNWLIKSWLNEYGKESARQICFACNRRPSIYIRPNILKTTAQKLLENLRTENIDAEIASFVIPAKAGIQKDRVTDDSMIRIKSPKAVTELPYFDKGWFTIQDITAALPVQLLQPKPDWTILDLCSAPGTKTTQLAELSGDKAKIIATDIDGKRLIKVKENLARLGVKNVTVVEYEKLPENSKFDAVLLDVPCSNTGVLAKRPEVRLRITPKTVTKLAKTQAELLEYAASVIKPKGKICYSTCSIQRAENGDVIKTFIKKHSGFSLEEEKMSLPSTETFDFDGGYTAILVKK
ncbi:MAG: transcription antitermination factor NusB [Phycisphaerae bacterium]|nr:transcription antitermination factor NusB [Phycisphaerae bacterium]